MENSWLCRLLTLTIFALFISGLIRNLDNDAEHAKTNPAEHGLDSDGTGIRKFYNESESSVAGSFEHLLRRDRSLIDGEENVFIEKFIQKRWNVSINVTKLKEEYSLICPLRDTCGVHLSKDLVYSGEMDDAFSDCAHCYCSRDCFDSSRCCPSSHYGYVKQDCVNSVLYPKEMEVLLNMVTTCLRNFNENQTVVDMCETEFYPCTSTVTGIYYSNMFCALCNNDKSCDPWQTDVKCPYSILETQLQFVSSFGELKKRALNQSECVISFNPNVGFVNSISYCDRKENNKQLISTCNTTGLWQENDVDILWACENFLSPYRKFKNVFCYICNPSVTAEQNVAIIDTCGPSNELSGHAIQHACKNFPVSKRLKPFKNIYCYACRKISNQSIFKENIRTVTVLSGNQTYETVNSRITVSVLSSGKDLLKNNEWYLHGLLWDDFAIVHSSVRHHKSNENTVQNREKLKRYTDVCGTGEGVLCYWNTSLRDQSNELVKTPLSGLYRLPNPVCDKCSCNNTCAEDMKCCWDLVLTKKPYSCVGRDYFPSFQKKKLSPGHSGMTNDIQNIRTAESYTLIDACLGAGSAVELEMNCSTATGAPFLHIPVTTKDKMIAYRNIYCYLCNNNNSNVTLNIEIHCNNFVEPALYTNMTLLLDIIRTHCTKIAFVPAYSSNCKGAEYNAEKSASLEGIGYERKESSIDVVFESVAVSEKEYPCSKRKVFEHCNETGLWLVGDVITKEICESVSVETMFLSEYRVYKKVYKNFACFLCNPDQLSDENDTQLVSECKGNNTDIWTEQRKLEDLCHSSSLQPRWHPYKNMYCAECNLPKWIKRECRGVYCTGGIILSNNTCRYFMKPAWNQKYNLKIALRLLKVHKTLTGKDNTSIIVNLGNLCETIGNQVINSFHAATTDIFVSSDFCYTLDSCLENGTDTVTVTFSDREELFVDLWITVKYAKDIMSVRETLIQALTATYHTEDISKVSGELFILQATHSFEEICISFTQTINHDFKASRRFAVDNFLTCPFVKFNCNDVLIDAQTLEIHVYSLNLSFGRSKYKELKGIGFAVCASKFRQMLYEKSTFSAAIPLHPLENTLSLFTSICTILSLISLFLTFITYSLFRDLRTVPGKINMILCVFLSVAQSLLQFGLNIKAHLAVCIAVGIGNHFFWMGTFCVMNVASIHMFKIFYLGQRFQTNTSKNLFVRYFLYIIALPSIFVLVVVAKSLTESEGTDIGYSKHYCFISDFNIFICTFVAPAGLFFISNIVFLALAFYRIHSSPRVQSTRNRHDFFLYIKLCTLVGITWPLLIFDNVIGISWFSFIVSGLNALQGVFIFYSYIINKRVAAMFISLVSLPTTEQGTRQTEPSRTRETKF
ncbi:uncharacterized protein LOC123560970 [Mercenaria mercenaria]|uniref:uncharacterized protein LOC123560970 n=1 Tax=Mercenaria mercenaria TaxID=6596 RepID=UPI00234EBA68|nr:uncharacterized protein LOC123560970 [Mercenaria mercenaria]